jgi:hypothetical protein
MRIIIDVPDYSPETGLQLGWQPGSVIRVSVTHGVPVITANSTGLETLANHFLTLAQPDVAAGTHIHYDDWVGLEEGSSELIVDKI